MAEACLLPPKWCVVRYVTIFDRQSPSPPGSHMTFIFILILIVTSSGFAHSFISLFNLYNPFLNTLTAGEFTQVRPTASNGPPPGHRQFPHLASTSVIGHPRIFQTNQFIPDVAPLEDANCQADWGPETGKLAR